MPSDSMTDAEKAEEERKTLEREGLSKPPPQQEFEPPEEPQGPQESQEPSDG